MNKLGELNFRHIGEWKLDDNEGIKYNCTDNNVLYIYNALYVFVIKNNKPIIRELINICTYSKS